MNYPCPVCDRESVEITLLNEMRRRFLCTGGIHEWLEGTEPFEDDQAERPNILRRLISKFTRTNQHQNQQIKKEQ